MDNINLNRENGQKLWAADWNKLVSTINLIIDAVNNLSSETEITKLSQLINDSGFITQSDISGKANKDELALVASTGNYNDLINLPQQTTGPQGPAGRSAYLVALDNGFVGTLEEWLASLKGEEGDDGVDGKSAYELYVASVPSGATPLTESQWLASLKGSNGQPGQDGADGLNGADGQDGLDGADGKSAYELAVELGYEGTLELWLLSLHGQDGTNGLNGTNGKSAYLSYLDTTTDNPVLTEQQWITSLHGTNGTNGTNGTDGVTPHIDSTSKHWMIGSTDTGILAEGLNGTNGTNGANGINGITPHIDPTTKHWMIGETDTGVVAEGQDGAASAAGLDGITPHIDSTTGNWFIGSTDTGVHAQGPSGNDGSNGTNGTNGITPHIDQTTGNWFIGETNTGVSALGPAGQNGTNGTNGNDGITPHIDLTTGNWFIGTTNTGVLAQGPAGSNGSTGQTGANGKSAYQSYVDTTSDNPILTEELWIASLHGANGTNGTNGSDGHTPVITASKSNGVTTILSDGTTIATINDGSDGSNGQNGHTPTITASKSNGVTTIAVDGTDVATINDGNNISPSPYLSFAPKAVTGSSYTYVDLGLPSGTLWATMNIGASDERDDGLFFSWGNIEGYANPSSSSENYSLTTGATLPDSTLSSGIPANTSFDAAVYNMNTPWRMPTADEAEELINNTDITYLPGNGSGYVKLANKSDNSLYIILPNTYDGNYSYNSSYRNEVNFWCSTRRLRDNYYRITNLRIVNKSNEHSANIIYSDDTYGRKKLYNIRGVISPNATEEITAQHYNSIPAAKVALSGDYNDLTNKPTIPTIWRGTQAQYDALSPNYDSNTIYIITAS